MPTMIKHLLLISASILLTHCSMMGVAYRNAEFLIEYRIDSYFDLNDSQEKSLAPEVKQLVHWFKNEEAAKIAGSLSVLRADIGDGLTPVELDRFNQSFVNHREKLMTKLIEAGDKMMASLSPEQINHLSVELKEGNESYTDLLEEENDDDLREEVVDGVIDSFEDWFGDLSDDQIATISSKIIVRREDIETRLNARLSAQSNFISLLRAPNPHSEKMKTLLSWVKSPEMMYAKQYREHYQSRRSEMKTRIFDLDRLLTSKQREHASKKILEFEDLLRGKDD